MQKYVGIITTYDFATCNFATCLVYTSPYWNTYSSISVYYKHMYRISFTRLNARTSIICTYLPMYMHFITHGTGIVFLQTGTQSTQLGIQQPHSIPFYTTRLDQIRPWCMVDQQTPMIPSLVTMVPSYLVTTLICAYHYGWSSFVLSLDIPDLTLPPEWTLPTTPTPDPTRSTKWWYKFTMEQIPTTKIVWELDPEFTTDLNMVRKNRNFE